MRSVRIVAPEPGKDGLARALGTKVYIGSTEVEGIAGIIVEYAPDDVVRATVELIAVNAGALTASARFTMADPITGIKKTIKRIEFADGTVTNL